MSSMFRYCPNITKLDLSCFDTSLINRMNNMFNNCQKLNDLNVSSFDASSVVDMGHMFSRCLTLTQIDFTNFDTSSVENFLGMFIGSSFYSLNLKNFNMCSALNKVELYINDLFKLYRKKRLFVD